MHIGSVCRIAADVFPPLPVKFEMKGPYDASKCGAPEHIRAKREAAEREIEEDSIRKEKGKGKAVEGPPSRKMPIMDNMPTPVIPQFVPRVAQPVAPRKTQGGPSTGVPFGKALSMGADEVLQDIHKLLQEQKKRQRESDEAAKIQGKTYAQMNDRPVVEKYIPAVADEQGGRRRGEAQHLEITAETAAAPTQSASGPSGSQNDQVTGLPPQVPTAESVKPRSVPHRAQGSMVTVVAATDAL